LGVDLAKSLDFTSFAIIHMAWDRSIMDFRYHLKGLDRIRGVNYPQIVDLIINTVERLKKESKNPNMHSDGPHLCLDTSGLGAPIKDYLEQRRVFFGGKYQQALFPVVFTGGEAARLDTTTWNYNISKTLIFGNFLSLMQHRRFDYAADLQALPLLEQEIGSFKQHLTPAGKTTFNAESGAHDDLLCAIAILLIIGEWQFNHGPKIEYNIPKNAIAGRPYTLQWW
jgi:hypothetical protein